MWFLFILVFHSKFFCSNPLPASLVVRGKVLSLPNSLFFLLLYNSSVSARTAIAGRRSLPLQNSSPWLCSDDSTWGERGICCHCCRLTTVVSSSYPLCLWVRVWGNVFWHDTERPTAGAAVHILLPEKKGRKTLKNMLLILYTWRRWVDDGEWSHLSLTDVALQMLLCVPLTDCASALVPTTQQYLLVLITSALSFPPMCHWFRILGSIQFPRNTLIFLMYDNVMKQLLSCLKHRGMQIC